VDSFPKPRTTKNRLILKQALQIAGLVLWVESNNIFIKEVFTRKYPSYLSG